MHEETRRMRQYLKMCPRKEYEQLVYESKLTPIEESVLKLCILDGRSNDEAADQLKCSARTISKLINQAYLKISNMNK